MLEVGDPMELHDGFYYSRESNIFPDQALERIGGDRDR